MLLAACIFWLGLQMNAPTWFYVVLAIYTLIQVFNFGQTYAKLVKSKKGNDDE